MNIKTEYILMLVYLNICENFAPIVRLLCKLYQFIPFCWFHHEWNLKVEKV